MVALTRQALSLDVTTVVVLPPFHHKGVSDDWLFAAISEAVERIADPRLRIVLHHIAPMSAVPITFLLIERLRALPRHLQRHQGFLGRPRQHAGAGRASQGWRCWRGRPP